MVNVLQSSTSRGRYRTPIETTGLGTASVAAIVREVRPNPISVVWDFSGANIDPNGNPASSGNSPVDVNALLTKLAATGPGTLYISGPNPSQIASGIGLTRLWINTGIPQAAGVGTWVLVFSQSGNTSGGSGGSGDGSGGGDGDGGGE